MCRSEDQNPESLLIFLQDTFSCIMLFLYLYHIFFCLFKLTNFVYFYWGVKIQSFCHLAGINNHTDISSRTRSQEYKHYYSWKSNVNSTNPTQGVLTTQVDCCQIKLHLGKCNCWNPKSQSCAASQSRVESAFPGFYLREVVLLKARKTWRGC